MALTAEQILSADDLPKVRVDVPEWAPPGTDPAEAFVFVRRMSGAELDEYENVLRQRSEGDKLTSLLGLRGTVVALTCCGDCGNRLFTSEQVSQLEAKSGEIVQRLFDAASDLNGLSKKSQEKLEKN